MNEEIIFDFTPTEDREALNRFGINVPPIPKGFGTAIGLEGKVVVTDKARDLVSRFQGDSRSLQSGSVRN